MTAPGVLSRKFMLDQSLISFRNDDKGTKGWTNPKAFHPRNEDPLGTKSVLLHAVAHNLSVLAAPRKGR